jgi:hypothetical protein
MCSIHRVEGVSIETAILLIPITPQLWSIKSNKKDYKYSMKNAILKTFGQKGNEIR